MKKTVSIFLSLLLVVLSVPISVVANSADAATITFEDVQTAPGGEFEVDLELSNNPGLVSASITLSFDEGLTLIGATNGNALPASIQFIKPKALSNGGEITGSCNFAWSGTDIKDKDIKDGIMLIMTFTVSSKAKNGDSYGITVTTRKGDFVDKKLSIVEIGAVESQVTVLSENAEIDSDEISEKSFRSIVDWLKRLIAMIKSLFSKIGKI